MSGIVRDMMECRLSCTCTPSPSKNQLPIMKTDACSWHRFQSWTKCYAPCASARSIGHK